MDTHAQDEKIRRALCDRLVEADAAFAELALQVIDGRLIVRGTLRSLDQQQQLIDVLQAHSALFLSLDCDIRVCDSIVNQRARQARAVRLHLVKGNAA